MCLRCDGAAGLGQGCGEVHHAAVLLIRLVQALVAVVLSLAAHVQREGLLELLVHGADIQGVGDTVRGTLDQEEDAWDGGRPGGEPLSDDGRVCAVDGVPCSGRGALRSHGEVVEGVLEGPGYAAYRRRMDHTVLRV